MSSCSDLTKDHENLDLTSQNSDTENNTSQNQNNNNSSNPLDSAVSKVMETLTYENCAASFFTTDKYTNLPYNILGTKFETENLVKQAVEARPWFTYRQGFSKIGNSSLTS